MKIEDVEKLMEESKEAMEYQDVRCLKKLKFYREFQNFYQKI